MDVQIFQYKESQLEEIRIILNDFLSFIANELSKPPWNFNLDEDHEVDLTINNLDKFAEPDGRLLLFEVDGQITGTISLRKIREYSGEIKRMYVRLKFRGEKLGNLMIEEVIRVSKENGFPKLIWWIVRFLFRPLYTLYRHLIFHRDDIDFPIP
jgi:GNAT superfamily N-acetyltransferase